jgi:hypothetical protein
MSDELWENARFHLDKGNFSALEDMLGGPDGFDRQMVAWFDAGRFADEPEMLAEALSCACMLGRTATASYLIDAGVDPYAGMKTWLAGPHYAVSSGHLETVEMLLNKGIPVEVRNLHGGTLLGQALWSVINEHRASHVAIIEALINAGAEVEDGTLEWWERQTVPDPATKRRVTEILMDHDKMYRQVG